MATKRTPHPSTVTLLLAAILQNPDEDTPRLAFADLLDEIGGKSNHDPAEFIRLECLLAPADAPHGVPPEARIAELSFRYHGKWRAGLRGVEAVRYERGFVGVVFAPAEAFIRHGETWFRCQPIRRVDLVDIEGRVDRLVAARSRCSRRGNWYGGSATACRSVARKRKWKMSRSRLCESTWLTQQRSQQCRRWLVC